MIWISRCWYDYQPMKQVDAKLFHNIPLIIKHKTRYVADDRYMKIFLTGLYRKETVSIKLPVQSTSITYAAYQASLDKILQKTCMKQWPLEDSFEYKFYGDFPDLKVPQTLGHIVPDWSIVREAAKVAIRMTTDDRDSLFISLYNEALKSGIYRFQKKYKQESMTPTEKALRIEEIPEDVKKFILHVSDVRIERETGNENKDTFDFIRMRISIPTESTFPNRKAFISKNMKWFLAVALNRLNGLKRFTRFNVPVTYLSLKNAVLTHTNELELLFELKDELRHIVITK